MSVSSPQISTLVKIMESLPVSLQERVTEHLREYINDLQDEIKWDNSFAKSQSKLVAAAKIAKQEIAEGKAVVLDFNQLWIPSILPSFWIEYRKLNDDVRQSARKAYRLWADNAFHPSLHFKCINSEESIWSVRITRNYRALGILDGDSVTWFWIGSHDDYEKFF